MEKLSDKEWLALRRYSTAPLSEVWRDAIDIVLLQRPTSYTVEEVCAAYNKPKPKTEETAASWNAALKVRLEIAEDKLRLIADWCAAYPLEMWPKPNMKKVRALLGDTLLTQLSAYNMRHVCEGIAKIAAQADGNDAVEESKTAQHPPA